MNIKYRNANHSDIPIIMNIVRQAQDSIKLLNIDQWQNGYPDEDIFNADIDKDQCYIFFLNETAHGVIIVSFEAEESYNRINGKGWITKNTEFSVIHRMAISDEGRGSGLAGEMLSFAEALSRQKKAASIRVDTHRGNIVMQRFLIKNGFTYCGHIKIDTPSGDPIRMAYEKILDK